MTTQIREHLNAGSFVSVLLSILWGLAVVTMFTKDINVLIVLGIAILVMVIRHYQVWIPYTAGVAIGLILALVFHITLPEAALLIVVFGSVLF